MSMNIHIDMNINMNLDMAMNIDTRMNIDMNMNVHMHIYIYRMGYRPGAADPPFMGGGRVSSDMYLYIYMCVQCCMYVVYDMRTYLCDCMFGCVEQMHVCVEQMHIV